MNELGIRLKLAICEFFRIYILLAALPFIKSIYRIAYPGKIPHFQFRRLYHPRKFWIVMKTAPSLTSTLAHLNFEA
jgi:hypothetical protein